jgi:hypothetical protein
MGSEKGKATSMKRLLQCGRHTQLTVLEETTEKGRVLDGREGQEQRLKAPSGISLLLG